MCGPAAPFTSAAACLPQAKKASSGTSKSGGWLGSDSKNINLANW